MILTVQNKKGKNEAGKKSLNDRRLFVRKKKTCAFVFIVKLLLIVTMFRGWRLKLQWTVVDPCNKLH